MAREIRPPDKKPCGACPYRRDVPSGIWTAEEYAKLPRYDADTPFQPTKVFLCHLIEPDDPRSRMCAGWVGCHDADNLLALRMAHLDGLLSPDTVQRAIDYESPLPLFASGAEAAAHGCNDIAHPSQAARRAIDKIGRARKTLHYE